MLFEIAFIGNYNRQDYPDVVEVRFTDLCPPYVKGVAEQQKAQLLMDEIG